MNGKAHLNGNGAAYENGSIETAARETGIVEPEAVPNSQRFEPSKTEKTKHEDQNGSAAKDAPHGA
jgi:acetyl-CoA carboxylase carboxyl transferase subunit beta